MYRDERLKYTEKDMLAFKHSSLTLSEYNTHRMETLELHDDNLYVAVLNVCSQVTGVDTIAALSSSRKPEAVFARFMTMWFMQKLSQQKYVKEQYSLAKLGFFAGGKDHSTAYHGIRSINDLIEVNEDGDKRLNWFRTAIRDLEGGLKIKIKY